MMTIEAGIIWSWWTTCLKQNSLDTDTSLWCPLGTQGHVGLGESCDPHVTPTQLAVICGQGCYQCIKLSTQYSVCECAVISHWSCLSVPGYLLPVFLVRSFSLYTAACNHHFFIILVLPNAAHCLFLWSHPMRLLSSQPNLAITVH